MNRAIPRVLGLILVAAIVIPTVYYSSQYVDATTLYPGDQLVVRECRICHGTGQCPEYSEEHPSWSRINDRCRACDGLGQVDSIAPGPNRPTVIHGGIVRPNTSRLRSSEPTVLSNAVLLTPLPGGLPGAEVVLTPQGDGPPIRVMTNSRGRFLVKLPPDDYHVKVRAAGYAHWKQELTVEPLTAPIWLEKIPTYIEPASPQERNAWYGRPLTIELEE